MIKQQQNQEYSKNIDTQPFGAPPQQFAGQGSTGTGGFFEDTDYEYETREYLSSNGQPEDHQQYSQLAQLGSTSPQIFSQQPFEQDFPSTPYRQCFSEEERHFLEEERHFSFDEGYSGEKLESIQGNHKDNFFLRSYESQEESHQNCDDVPSLFYYQDSNIAPQQDSYYSQLNPIEENVQEELQCISPTQSTSAGPSQQGKELPTPTTKRQKKKNIMRKNACEETKNLFNYIMPSIEKSLQQHQQWRNLNQLKSQGNHKSIVFLNALAKEAQALKPEQHQLFQKDFEKIVKKDLRILALNQQKMEVTFVILSYADSLMTVINNPNRFKSIKKAKLAHGGQQVKVRNSRR